MLGWVSSQSYRRVTEPSGFTPAVRMDGGRALSPYVSPSPSRRERGAVVGVVAVVPAGDVAVGLHAGGADGRGEVVVAVRVPVRVAVVEDGVAGQFLGDDANQVSPRGAQFHLVREGAVQVVHPHGVQRAAAHRDGVGESGGDDGGAVLDGDGDVLRQVEGPGARGGRLELHRPGGARGQRPLLLLLPGLYF